MHTVPEYTRLLKEVIVQAEKMANCLPPGHSLDGWEVISFLKNYGCEGYPVGRKKDFDFGPWLGRTGRPATQYEGVSIIPCFSDDVPPVELPATTGSIIPGSCLYTDQVILLYNVDHWSLAERALVLLHEGRHARQRIGPKLAHLLPLDRVASLHETNTWLFTLNILLAWGGTAWKAAVQREVTWLTEQKLVPQQAGQIMYAASHHHWPELDSVFGPTLHEEVKQVRQQWVAIQANMRYWPRQNPSFLPEQICHSVVSRWYS